MKKIHYLLILIFSITLLSSIYLFFISYKTPSHFNTTECNNLENNLFKKSKEEFYQYQNICSTNKMTWLIYSIQGVSISLLLILLIIILKPNFQSIDDFWKSIVGIKKIRLVIFILLMFAIIVILHPIIMYIEAQSWYLHRTEDSYWIWMFWARIQWILLLIWFLLYIETWEKYIPWYQILSLPPISNRWKYFFIIIYKFLILFLWYFIFWYWSVFWLFIILCIRASHNWQTKAKLDH